MKIVMIGVGSICFGAKSINDLASLILPHAEGEGVASYLGD